MKLILENHIETQEMTHLYSVSKTYFCFKTARRASFCPTAYWEIKMSFAAKSRHTNILQIPENLLNFNKLLKITLFKLEEY